MFDPQKLYQLLSTIDFPTNYYSFVEKTRDRAKMSSLTKEMMQEVLSLTGHPFRYFAKEKTYGFVEETKYGQIGLNIGYNHSQLEFILILTIEEAEIGAPFAVLALQTKRLTIPSFEYNPLYPQIKFSSREELAEAIGWGTSLYQEVKEQLSSATD